MEPQLHALMLQDASEGWSAGVMGEDLTGSPFASHVIDPALFPSQSGELGAEPPASDARTSGAAHDATSSDSAREVFGASEHADVLDGGDALVPEATQELSLRGGLMDTPENVEEPPLDTAVDPEPAEHLIVEDAYQPPELSVLVLDGESEGNFDPGHVLVVFELQGLGQQGGSAEDEGDLQRKEPFVGVCLYVGQLPDPTADDPSTPPLSQNAVSIEEVFEAIQEQLQDPARGWGVLMSDVRKVLTPARFHENAGSRMLPTGYVTWPVFVRTVLHTLHR